MNKFLLILLLVLLDFISKKFILNFVEINQFITINTILDITHIHNYGISFGLLAGIIPSNLIVIIGLIITIIIIYMAFKSKKELEKWSLSLIIAGAISNILDRIMNNYVLDFIYFNYNNFYWPAFNFADIYISIGVIMIIFHFLKDFNKNK